jgi:hypothetical protein
MLHILYFRNKGDLVRHLMAKVEREMRIAALVSMTDMDNFGRDEFQQFMRKAVEIQCRHRSAIRATAEISAYDKDAADAYQNYMDNTVSDTRRVIEKLIATGRSHPGVQLEIGNILAWAAERSCNKMLRDDDNEQQRQALSASTSILCGGCDGRSPGCPMGGACPADGRCS